MSVRSTSKAAYEQLKLEGKDQGQRARILAILMNWSDLSLRELQQTYQRIHGVHLDVGTFSARCKELKDDKVIFESGPRKCTVTGRTVNPVTVQR